MGYNLPHCRCSGYVGEDARCYSLERGATSTLHPVWSILQHLLLVFEFARSFALDQVGLMNLDPLRRLNGRAMKIYMIEIYILIDDAKLMKPKMVVNQRPHQGFDEVMFPTKMREKGTRVTLANGSSITKSIKFSISFRELECNSVYLNMHTFLLMLGGLFIALIQLLGGSL